MTTFERLRKILSDALHLGSRADALTPNSPLLGAIPEFDSMAVVTVLSMVEAEFAIAIDDDEISADVFASLNTLTVFIDAKINA